jgi:Fic family protein
MDLEPDNRLGERIRCTVAAEEPYWAYVPSPLPPVPAVKFDERLLEQASQAIGRLDGLASVLPDTDFFLYIYIRKEAVLSSQIEGTQSSLSDLLLYESDEAPAVPVDDVQEVSNYVAAMNHGLERLKEGFPLSMRLMRELHEILLSGTRGGSKSPGEFRRSQNWIGGSRPGNARFVPAPPDRVIQCMSDLEKFLHSKDHVIPVLVKTALTHQQFETIHPFLDGNGRLGRLLITLLLCHEKILDKPILYLSLYFKAHRDEYYSLLQSVREKGDWESWLQFFLRGVLDTASQETNDARQILSMMQSDRTKIANIGAGASSALQVFQYLERKPLAVIQEIVKASRLSTPTVTRALQNLQEIGIVREITGKPRRRVFVYSEYLRILERDA